MSHAIVIRALAEADIAEAARWYEDQKVGLGVEFLAVVESAIHRAALMPLVYQCIRRRPDVRRILTKRFPYRIFFILRPGAIIIFRLLHNARDEREWKNAFDG